MRYSVRWAVPIMVALLAVTASLAPRPVHAQEADKKIQIDLQSTPLRDAIRLIFLNSGLQYSVDPNVPNVPIDLKLRDVSLQQALRLVIRQAASSVPGLTSSKEGDVFVIKIRQQTPTSLGGAPEDQGPPPEFTEGEEETEWDRIPAQFVDIRAILMGLSGMGYVPTDAEIMMMTSGMGGGMMGGGMGGGMMGGGMMGGMGGMGGGFGGGMMGGMGGMGGMMGGMGGGMMGGMGGMMGGMGGFGGGMGGFGGGMGGFGGGMGGFGGGGFGNRF